MKKLYGNDAEAHARLVAVGKARRRIDAEEAKWLIKAVEMKLHLKVSIGSMVDYCVEVLRHDRRTAQERVRTATALATLPVVAGELCGGEMCWSAARELSRFCTPETEQRWVEEMKGKSVREIEEACSGRVAGDLPDSPRDEGARTFTISFELNGEQYARYRAAKELAVKVAESPIDEATAVDAIMAAYLAGGPSVASASGDEASAEPSPSSQPSVPTKPRLERTGLLSMEQCPDCARGSDISTGTKIELDLAAIELRLCDPKAVYGAHVGAQGMEIPAATRRAVLARDRHRCKVPRCNNHRFLQIHHLEHLMHGGTHDLWNLILLCTAHHQAHHAGLLEITGRVGIDLTFNRIDPTPTWASTLANSVADELSRLTA